MLDVEIPELDARDRCDWPACSAQARAVIWFGPDTILTACRHHTERDAVKLIEQAWFIDRQYDGLYSQPERGSFEAEGDTDEDDWDDD